MNVYLNFLAEEELKMKVKNERSFKTVTGDVEFKNVRFGYSEEKIVINNFHAVAKAGQKVAIVGPTGAGKTTLVNLLMSFYEINGGEIYIDGAPISMTH